MAYLIQPNCTACGDCLAACPNEAIRPGFLIPRIEAILCTECLGFAVQPRCVTLCPEDAIKPLGTEAFRVLWEEYTKPGRPSTPPS